MKVDGKIGISQAIMTMMLTVGITNHVNVIPLLLSSAKRDAWLSVLLASIPFIVWACILSFINNRLHQQSLHQWLRRTSGKFVSYLILIPLLISIYGMALVHLIDTQTWTTVNYLPRTPEWFTALVLMGICIIAAFGGIAPLGITAALLLPIVAILGFFVAFGNVPKKDYSLLLPVFQHGIAPIWEGMIYAGGGFCELVLLLLLQHHVRKPLRLVHYLAMIAIVIILTLSPLTGAIAEFGPIESSRQRFPAFEQWRLLSIGKDIENMEFFAIFQWLSGSFVRISLCLLLLTEILEVHTPKSRSVVLFVLGISMIVITSLPFSDMQFVGFLTHLYYPLYMFITILLTLAIAGIALWNRKREGNAEHDA
ncbi:GerAB/ArcD/ProY family transporter [Brevibacillus choshinensis]|uniref:Endospore germination permease n=1 Tax=Brevibacillus choshinensis TaxID=54911 RepID=A0ABX7FLB8_BRECH|nr:endospore germination permease [Brevibacillus choshinensis]QRG67033.1 endospore germination permease [Brevibacillus choshinensis]